MYKHFFKRVIDLTVSVCVLVLASPIFIVIFFLLILANEGKPFFLQQRPGKGEKLFRIVKFKTMNDKKDKKGDLLPDAQRLTKVGSFVRKTSLDELPQLLNVVMGDMSLIGPRPLLVRYLGYYRENERIRHTVRPGITGWAQINGRNTVKWDERLALDVEYVNHLTFKMDLKILYLTMVRVLKSDNVVVDPRSFMRDLDEERKNGN